VTAGIALSGLVAGTGCSNSTTDNADAAAAPTRPVQVHEADVIVVGGGLAGLTAARKAASDGSSVIILDKGLFGHSGTSGINWGHDLETNEWLEDDGSSSLPTWILLNDGLPDQTYALEFCKAVKEGRPNATTEQMGCVLERIADGSPVSHNAPAPLNVDHGCFPRFFAQQAKHSGKQIFDRTMALDVLLADDGRAAGVVALDLVSGDALVFRGKAVVMATGSYCWVAGWNGMSPFTIAGPENTGDGHRMFINAGLEMRDMEQLPFDNVQWTPIGTRQGMGSMGNSIVNHARTLNKDMERFTQAIDTDPRLNNPAFMRLTAKEIWQGRGTENGGVFVDTADLETDDRYYRRARENEMRAMGYDLPQYVEVVPEQWETAARPYQLSTSSETAIPGLFFAAANSGAYSGCAFMGCFGSGWMAGKGAAVTAASSDAAAVPWTKVNDILNSAYGLLEATPESPIRVTDVYRSVQNAYWSGLSPLRDDAGIKASIAELERIKAEDLPKMHVPSKSRQFNTDWRLALEVESLITCALGTGQAALVRTETRGAHCRTDYPKMDNANWLKNTVVKLDGATWSVRTEPIDDSIVPAADVAALVPELGID